ncbi:HNH endonuclease [Cytobacillus spongiae]|uniref:HNH endonuclease n=1 Tax=Cytobacillus spongiae TaxID=2901381 RepID=UPI001F19C3AC|nr:HNH endonuclease signature motif containing protein [Cytobacillus spongiae]UII56702.1 HNH endonuclease [Cytobacillus spongiae]
MTIDEINKLLNEGNIVKFYNCRKWRKLSKRIQKRDNYECQKCKRRGKYSKGKNVHHIRELKVVPELAYAEDNLETLCISCHNEEHPEKLEGFKKPEPKFINDERW